MNECFHQSHLQFSLHCGEWGSVFSLDPLLSHFTISSFFEVSFDMLPSMSAVSSCFSHLAQLVVMRPSISSGGSKGRGGGDIHRLLMRFHGWSQLSGFLARTVDMLLLEPTTYQVLHMPSLIEYQNFPFSWCLPFTSQQTWATGGQIYGEGPILVSNQSRK